MEENKMNFSKFNDLDLEEKIVESNFNNDLQLLRKIFLENKLADIKKLLVQINGTIYICYSEPKVELVQFYIDNGVDVNAQDIYGMTPLHYALRSKNIDAAIALLKAGANPNLPNERGITPLSYINGFPERLDLLQLMLDNGGDVDFFTGQHGILEGIKKYRSQDPKFKPVIELMEKYSKKGI